METHFTILMYRSKPVFFFFFCLPRASLFFRLVFQKNTLSGLFWVRAFSVFVLAQKEAREEISGPLGLRCLNASLRNCLFSPNFRRFHPIFPVGEVVPMPDSEKQMTGGPSGDTLLSPCQLRSDDRR